MPKFGAVSPLLLLPCLHRQFSPNALPSDRDLPACSWFGAYKFTRSNNRACRYPPRDVQAPPLWLKFKRHNMLLLDISTLPYCSLTFPPVCRLAVLPLSIPAFHET